MISLSTFKRIESAEVPTFKTILPDGRRIFVEKHAEDVDLGYFYRVVIHGVDAFEGWFDGFDTGNHSVEGRSMRTF
jgi:hypothetical protein